MTNLLYPFPSATSEHAEVVQVNTTKWSEQYGLGNFDHLRLGHLAARTHPGMSVDALQIVADFQTWLFLRDDKSDDNNEVLPYDRFYGVMEGGRTDHTDDPMTIALENLLKRVRGFDPSRVDYNSFVKAMVDHLEATVWESNNRKNSYVPDLKSYVRIRPVTGGLNIITELDNIVEPTANFTVRNHSKVVRITDLSHRIPCWMNDILSLEKEVANGEVNNLVLSVQKDGNLDLERALKRSEEIHNEDMKEFVSLSSDLPTFWNEGWNVDLDRYVKVLQSRVQGVFDWTTESARYRA